MPFIFHTYIAESLSYQTLMVSYGNMKSERQQSSCVFKVQRRLLPTGAKVWFHTVWVKAQSKPGASFQPAHNTKYHKTSVWKRRSRTTSSEASLEVCKQFIAYLQKETLCDAFFFYNSASEVMIQIWKLHQTVGVSPMNQKDLPVVSMITITNNNKKLLKRFSMFFAFKW